MRIGLLPSTQWSSVGNGITGHSEAELAQDVTARLVPKLQAAGHTVEVFAGKQDANSDGARALVAWGCDMAVSLHLDAASGPPAALLCYQEERSKAMGEKILAVYCYEMGIKNKGSQHRVPGQKVYIPTGDGVAVLRIPEAAGIKTALIEMGDMNKPDGANWLNPSHREKAADAMAKAICAVAGGVLAPPQKRREDEMQSWQYDNVTEVSKIDCYKDKADYYVTTKGTSPVVTFTLEGHKPLGGGGTTEAQDVSGIQDHNIQDLLKQDRLKSIKGSYGLTVTSASPITISIREVPK